MSLDRFFFSLHGKSYRRVCSLCFLHVNIFCTFCLSPTAEFSVRVLWEIIGACFPFSLSFALSLVRFPLSNYICVSLRMIEMRDKRRRGT